MGNVYGRMSAIQSIATSAVSLAAARASPSKLRSLTTGNRMVHGDARRPPQRTGSMGSSGSGASRRRRSSGEHQITARITRQASRLARSRGSLSQAGFLRRSARLGGPNVQSHPTSAMQHQHHGEHRGARQLTGRDPLSVQSRLRRSARIARQSRGPSRRQSQLRPSSAGNGTRTGGRR